MSDKLFTTIKTNQGNVKIPQDDRELQKVVSLIYSMDQEIDQLKAENESIRSQLLAQCKISNELLDEKDQLKAQIQKMRSWKNCTLEKDTKFGCDDASSSSCPCDK